MQNQFMIKIYHNNRCRKSREGLAILENSEHDYEVIQYLDHPPTADELKSILKKLNIKPLDLVRKNEKIWKEEFKNEELSDAELIDIMCQNPKLIERPIVVSEKRAVIGRPPENIHTIL